MDFCRVERDGPLLVVTMNRPDKLNALIPQSHEEMAAIFRGFEDDPALRVAILTGAGRAFCAGSDISAYVAGTNRPLLLRTEMGAGHGGPSGRYDSWRDEARTLTFLLVTL